MRSRTIAAAAKAAGIKVETIRFYERRGLIARPERPSCGPRHYPDGTVARLRFIREAQGLGFTLGDIAELLALRADPAADCADVRLRAIARLDDVRTKIAQLERISTALDVVIAACPSQGALGACSILEAIEHPSRDAAPPARRSNGSFGKQGEPVMKTQIFSIDGMHCEGCAETVRTLLSREPGVKAVEVSHAPGRARVLYDTAAVSDEQLTKTIERPGYRVTGVS
ncbi:MAG: MerR family DNA-binding protein [Rhodospirillales bacterium]|nr:MerR family DNA-binding protein [Rhodospirillales bacterium]